METFSASLAICAGNSPVPGDFPHKGQWRGALMFSLICVWINGWTNSRETGDLRRYRAHCDVIVMECEMWRLHCNVTCVQDLVMWWCSPTLSCWLPMCQSPTCFPHLSGSSMNNCSELEAPVDLGASHLQSYHTPRGISGILGVFVLLQVLSHTKSEVLVSETHILKVKRHQRPRTWLDFIPQYDIEIEQQHHKINTCAPMACFTKSYKFEQWK